MSILLYIAGTIIGVTAFLYLVSLLNDGKEKLTGTAPSAEGKTVKKITGEVNAPALQSVPPGERMCPLCRSKLTKYEALYAAPVVGDRDQKLMIYGCRYCYKGDEDPNMERKSVL